MKIWGALRSLSLASALLLTFPAWAEMRLASGTTLAFGAVDEGRAVLGASDDYTRRMSPFDRSLRLQVERDVDEAEYRAWAADQVVPWSEAAREKIEAAFALVREALDRFDLPLPERVLLTQTTGREEAGHPYTRAAAIILPGAVVEAADVSRLGRLLCHEIFHVMSRADPSLHDRLYGLIGFERLPREVELPAELRDRRLTNPDAPRVEHAIRVTVAGVERWAAPVTYAITDRYDPAVGSGFFQYLQTRFLLLERFGEGFAETGELIEFSEAEGFFEQVGRNTQYLIHPEETLADNFTLAAVGATNLPSPEVVELLKRALGWRAQAESPQEAGTGNS
jgi:hypothetical protein